MVRRYFWSRISSSACRISVRNLSSRPANDAISLTPPTVLISLLFSLIAYWLGNFHPSGSNFFIWVLWLFLDLLAAESLVILVSSIIPIFVAALAVTAFANGLWMSVGGFLVPLPILNVFWKYAFHYWDYQSYVFQAMMVNEFVGRRYSCAPITSSSSSSAFSSLPPSDGAGSACHCMFPSDLQSQCLIPGEAVLAQYGYPTDKQAEWLGIMVAIIFCYRLAGWLVTYMRKT
jgi:hypothetical protein